MTVNWNAYDPPTSEMTEIPPPWASPPEPPVPDEPPDPPEPPSASAGDHRVIQRVRDDRTIQVVAQFQAATGGRAAGPTGGSRSARTSECQAEKQRARGDGEVTERDDVASSAEPAVAAIASLAAVSSDAADRLVAQEQARCDGADRVWELEGETLDVDRTTLSQTAGPARTPRAPSPAGTCNRLIANEGAAGDDQLGVHEDRSAGADSPSASIPAGTSRAADARDRQVAGECRIADRHIGAPDNGTGESSVASRSPVGAGAAGTAETLIVDEGRADDREIAVGIDQRR